MWEGEAVRLPPIAIGTLAVGFPPGSWGVRGVLTLGSMGSRTYCLRGSESEGVKWREPYATRATRLSCHLLSRIELATLHHVSVRRLQCSYGLVNQSVHSRLSRRFTCLRDQFPGILQILHRCWV